MEKGAFSGGICDLKARRASDPVFTKIHGHGAEYLAKFAQCREKRGVANFANFDHLEQGMRTVERAEQDAGTFCGL